MMLPYLLFSAAMFSVGVYGVLARRNLLIVLMSIELMLNGVNIALVAFSRLHGGPDGQVFVLMVMAVAAAEVAVGLAILIALFRTRRTVDTGDLTSLKG
ncbi:MAG: NADH-quinone oxidoreductase subunit NuoK [Planctomycetes bacterium]|nr:NADH-quinone oxidoreductase subunit NuoK [Planctomycetota bacterium]